MFSAPTSSSLLSSVSPDSARWCCGGNTGGNPKRARHPTCCARADRRADFGRMPMNAARPLRYQRGYVIFAVAAVLALLQPLFTPLVPELAGWLPGHQHVSVNGVPVDHAHPWDDRTERDAPATSEAPAGFIFHLCDIHPDGWVPVGSTSSPGPTEVSRSAADAA